MISPQALKDFKEICKAELGFDVSDEIAIAEGINLLTLFDHIYQPIKREWGGAFIENEPLESTQ